MGKEQMGKLRKKEDWETIAEIKHLDSRNRAVFPPEIADLLKGGFDLAQNQKGEIKVIPMARVPAEEAWIYKNPEILKKIDRGMADSKAGRVKEISIDDL